MSTARLILWWRILPSVAGEHTVREGVARVSPVLMKSEMIEW